ncbi:sulfurtransferase TusA [Psychrobacter sp. I-STPA10]|uniref:sulfurtransferase TusA n=1 Tax=Psychrobacter sp. I-STPA10 TaxID=2585769 RepID=UPI001E348350|nr:sulfurtransferase TusA [Psychrobacter sp. I-STPA10]
MSQLSNETELTIDHYLDTQGLICPEPVMLLHKSIRHAEAGELIEVLATDPATTRDIPNFCRHLGHQLLVQQTLAQTLDTDSTNNMNNMNNMNNISHYRYVIQKKQA